MTSEDWIIGAQSLLAELSDYYNQVQLIPREWPYVDAVLLGLFSKSLRCAGAVLCLVQTGFQEEAFGLCRTCLEIELTVRYLTNKDTVQRCKRYVQYFARDNREWKKLIDRYYPAAVIRSRSDEERIIRLAANYKSAHKWSEAELKYFASEPDEFERSANGENVTEIFFYEVIYRWMSQYVHSTVSGLTSHEPEAGVPFHTGPSRRGVYVGDHASRTALVSILLNNLRMTRTMNFDFPQDFADRLEVYVRAQPTKV